MTNANLLEKGIIPSINFHLWQPCNMRCKFCFATFQDVKNDILPKGHLPQADALQIVEQIGAFGFEKITFAGGEPTLCPWLPALIQKAKAYGMTTGIVTNGTMLNDDFLLAMKKDLDWIALSVDSLNPNTNLESGRAIVGKHPLSETYYRQLIERIKSYSYKLKINTVVSQYNWLEEMTDFIQWAQVDRWKVLQALPIEGQNDSHTDAFSISLQQFDFFQQKHQYLSKDTNCVFEDTDSIKGSYMMLDPAGRFFNNTSGCYIYSPPVLEVGVAQAIQFVRVDMKKYLNRDGYYQW